jgi:hypothetical protein
MSLPLSVFVSRDISSAIATAISTALISSTVTALTSLQENVLVTPTIVGTERTVLNYSFSSRPPHKSIIKPPSHPSSTAPTFPIVWASIPLRRYVNALSGLSGGIRPVIGTVSSLLTPMALILVLMVAAAYLTLIGMDNSVLVRLF